MKRCRQAIAEPLFLLWLNRALKWVFIIMIPVSEFSGLKSSLPWIVFMSLWALVVSHWTTERALEAQLEVRRDAPSS